GVLSSRFRERGARGGVRTAVDEDSVAGLAFPSDGGSGGWLRWDDRDLPGGAVTAGHVAEVDLDVVEQIDREAFDTGVDGMGATILDQALQQTNDTVRAAE